MAKLKYDKKTRLLLTEKEIEKIVVRNAVAHGAVKIGNINTASRALIVTVDGKEMVLTPKLGLRNLPQKNNKNRALKQEAISKIK